MSNVRYFVGVTEAKNESCAAACGDLMGLPVFKEVSGDDPVLSGRFFYEDGGWTWVGPCPRRPVASDPKNTDPPVCAPGCKYIRLFQDFSQQRNALRLETASLVQEERCGWNLLPGRYGGHPLDYAPCSSSTIAKATGEQA